MSDEITRLRSLYAPAYPLWVDKRGDDGEFPAAEENMIDWAEAWFCPSNDPNRVKAPYRIKITSWHNNVPVAAGATHVVYAVIRYHSTPFARRAQAEQPAHSNKETQDMIVELKYDIEFSQLGSAEPDCVIVAGSVLPATRSDKPDFAWKIDGLGIYVLAHEATEA